MLKEKILNKESGIITYGLTPPKKKTSPEKIKEIAETQINRIKDLDLDALILYDLQDESDRVDKERPFPFLPTIDPAVYSKEYLSALNIPRIIYRCVGKYSKEDFSSWLKAEPNKDRFSVFVGASSKDKDVKLKLKEGYRLRKKLNPDLILGGVTIPERHSAKNNEDQRILKKIDYGCRFFVSQCVYNLSYAKNLLSDYYYHCQEHNQDMVPIIFTFTPCGSEKTLKFMKWLGINIPQWLENDLKHSEDILEKSVQIAKENFKELFAFAQEKNIPIGCNIESVSIRKVEIEASIQLAKDVKKIITSN